MKSFYQLTPKGIKLMEKLDVLLETAADFEIEEDHILDEIQFNHFNLYTIWKEWHSMEFCDRDLPNVLGINRIGDLLQNLEKQNLIKETYNDNN
jgi:hypothetical protein